MEERTIKLTLEKAREFYNKGGELRGLALSIFTIEELTQKLPKTWEEFCDSSLISLNEHYITPYGGVQVNSCAWEKRNPEKKNLLPTREDAYKHLAYMQLHQLRNRYRQEWMPSDNRVGFSITRSMGEYLRIDSFSSSKRFLSFQSKEIANEFLNNFYDLIKKAGDLV